MAKQNFPFTLAARAHVIRFQENLKNWEAGLEQAMRENDAAGIEFCTRCVATAKGQLAKAKDQALDITIW
jgi:hypothetical protein